MITEQQRAAVVAGLLELRAFWSTLSDSEHTVKALADELQGFSAEEITAAFRFVRGNHEHASAPKPWHIRQAAAQAARRLRWKAPDPKADDTAPDFCPQCHTPDLYETPVGRLHALHRTGCVLRMADQDVEVRMAEERNAVWYGGRDPKHIGRGAA